MYAHIHTSNGAVLQKSSHIFSENQNNIFTLVPLATCGAFPVTMVMISKSLGARERDGNKTAMSFCRNVIINKKVFASASETKEKLPGHL